MKKLAIFNMAYVRAILVSFGILFTSVVFGQTQTQRQQIRSASNISVLEQMAVHFDSIYTIQKAEADQWTIDNGAPISGTLPDGSSFEIQRIRNGKPIYYVTFNENAAKTVSTDKVWTGTALNLDGSGITIGEWDGGKVKTNHQELVGNVTQIDGWPFINDHATHIAGTMISKGIEPGTQGMASGAQLHSYMWDSDLSEMQTFAASGYLLSNHSYGEANGWQFGWWIGCCCIINDWFWLGDVNISASEDYDFGFYTQEAKNRDELAFNAPYYLIVQAAGNDRGEAPPSGTSYYVDDGTGLYSHACCISSTPCTAYHLSTVPRDPDGGTDGYDCIPSQGVAKNILTVGAIDDIPAGYSNPADVFISSKSGWGPTDDGRIKPDIVANGIDVYSCIGTSTTSYNTISGTSMAAANVTGSLALLQQHYRDTYAGLFMMSATLKALVIHTADDAKTAGGGPDYEHGWGLLNTETAANLITQDNVNCFNNIQELVLNNSATYQFDFDYDGTSPFIKATIVWTDPAGTPFTSGNPPDLLNPPDLMLVNDLDLQVLGPGGTSYPWVLDPVNPANPASNTTTDNVLDNVEQVYISAPPAGAYTVQVTHKGTLQGGNPQPFSLIISGTAFDLLQIALKTSQTVVICNGGSDGTATVIACGGTPPYTYFWSDGQTTTTASGLAAGTYTITVTDASSLSSSETITLTDPPALTLSLFQNDISCNGVNNGNAIVIANDGVPPYSYLWSTGSTSDGIFALPPGTYGITVTDANGCTASGSVTINDPAVLTVSTTITDVSCNGGSDGTATATASGGTPPYWYNISSQSTNAYISGTFTATGLAAGTYIVEVWDNPNNACYFTTSVTINEPSVITVSTTTTNALCDGASDGTATVTASGGTSPYTYSWNTTPVQTTVTATGLAAGTYTVTVTDANGCTNTGTAMIANDPYSLSVSVSSTDGIDCNVPASDISGTATANVSGGTPLYTYLWNDPNTQTTATATELAVGTYNVTVTDANGCIITGSGTVNSAPPVYDFVNPVITGTVYWQFGSFKVKGVVIIEAGGVLNMGWADFEFSYDVITEIGFDYDRARIVIKPGGKLISNYVTLNGCEGGIWDGIENWGDETLPQNNAVQGVLEMDNTTIINAQMGIFCGRRALINAKIPPLSGGIVRAINSAFINNYLAVKMRSYPDFNSANYFKDCTFEYNSSSPYEYISGPKMEFINLFDYHGLKILGCHFINTTPNDFAIQDRGWGIKSTDASYIVDELCINQQQFPCPAFQPTIFENLYYGIEATASNSLNSVSITKSKFLFNNRGILLRGVDYAVITENEFDLGDFVIDNCCLSYGFYLENCTGYLLEGNIIHSTANTGLIGSYIENSGNDANELYRNEYFDLVLGSVTNSNNSGTEIRCNSYTNIGFADIHSIGSLAQDQGFCSTPGDLDEDKTPAGNQFSYTTSDGDIVAGLTSNINYNHHSNGNAYNTIPLNYSTPYIIPNDCQVGFIPSTSCPSNLPPDCDLGCQQALIVKYEDKVTALKALFDGGDKDFLLALIHQDKPAGMVKNALLAASPYLTDRVLIAAFNEKPTPLPAGVLKQVIIANSPITSKLKSALDNRRPALPKGIKNEIETVQTGTSARAALEREMVYFDRRRELSVSAKIRYYLHSDTIPGAMDSVIAILVEEEILEEVKEKEEIIEEEPIKRLQPKRKLADAHLKKGDYTKAQQKVDTLIQVPEFENFGRLKQVMIDIESSNKTYFEIKDDTIKEAKVRYVASDSTKYGYIHARAMIDRVFNERIPEKFIQFWLNNNNARLTSDNTENKSDNFNIKEGNDTQISFYPNPASETVHIKYKLPENSNQAIVTIYNMRGEKINNYEINKGQEIINWDVTGLQNGLYLFTIIVNNNTIARKKLMIIK